MVAGPRHFLEGDCPLRGRASISSCHPSENKFQEECSLAKPGYQELAAHVAGRYAFPFRAVLRSKNALACTSYRDSQEVCSALRTRPAESPLVETRLSNTESTHLELVQYSDLLLAFVENVVQTAGERMQTA
jgi:hypothetical protein